MRLLWQARSNPLAWWWAALSFASGANIALWLVLYRQFHMQPAGGADNASGIQLMLFLCAAYVFGCAFGRFCRGRMCNASACSIPGYRALPSAVRSRPLPRSALQRSGPSSCTGWVE